MGWWRRWRRNYGILRGLGHDGKPEDLDREVSRIFFTTFLCKPPSFGYEVNGSGNCVCEVFFDHDEIRSNHQI